MNGTDALALKSGGRGADEQGMGNRRPQRVQWPAIVGVLAMVVGGAGITAAALDRSSGRDVDRSRLAAANLAPGTAVADQAATATSTTTPAVAPVTSVTTVTAPKAAPATAGGPTTTGAARATVAPAATPKPGATTTVPTDWAALVPPIPAPPNPASWTLEENGVSVRLTMTPIAPHVGDTVEFSIESSTTVGNGACCITSLYVGQDIIYQQMSDPSAGCSTPPPPERPQQREGRVSYRISGPPFLVFPAPLILNVSLSIVRIDDCFVPFHPIGAHLSVPVTALYPAH